MRKEIKYINESEFTDDITDLFLKKAEPHQNLIDYRMQLAAKIISAVRKKGWDNSTFAAKMHIKNTSIVTKWFSGTNNFEVDTLYKIQDLLGITLLDLDEPKMVEPAVYFIVEAKPSLITPTYEKFVREAVVEEFKSKQYAN